MILVKFHQHYQPEDISVKGNELCWMLGPPLQTNKYKSCNQRYTVIIRAVSNRPFPSFKKHWPSKWDFIGKKKVHGKMTFCLNSNRKLFHVFALIDCKYSRFQKGLGQLTDGLSDVIESRFAVFSNSFSKKVSLWPSKAGAFPKQGWLGSIGAALSSLVVVSPLFWGDEYWQPPQRSNSQEITLTNLKNWEPYITKNAFKKTVRTGRSNRSFWKWNFC